MIGTLKAKFSLIFYTLAVLFVFLSVMIWLTPSGKGSKREQSPVVNPLVHVEANLEKVSN
ncbi:hypothetical protein JW979_16520 [bacterium]|nr:hypothetical protein [candidate division CSSED10-310 bacterium]